jgi:hypothetical protein
MSPAACTGSYACVGHSVPCCHQCPHSVCGTGTQTGASKEAESAVWDVCSGERGCGNRQVDKHYLLLVGGVLPNLTFHLGDFLDYLRNNESLSSPECNLLFVNVQIT